MGVNALFTAVSGLNANQSYLGAIGNNIANSNTIGFKSSDPVFENLVSQTLGGTSNSQEGLGTQVFAIQGNFSQGALENTSSPLNMAIDGNGFFIVQSPNGTTYYTRNGDFSENSEGEIVDSTGQNVVQGYPLNSSGVASSGTPQAITLSTGAISPKATTTADLTANLDSDVSAQSTSTITSTSSADNFMGGYVTQSAASGATSLDVNMVYNGSAGATPSKLLVGNGDGTSNLYSVSSYTDSAGNVYTYDTTNSVWDVGGNPAQSMAPGTTINSVTFSSPLTASISQNTAVSQNSLAIDNASSSGMQSGDDIQINTTSTAGAYQYLDNIASVNSGNTVSLSNALPVSSAAGAGGTAGTGFTGGTVVAGPISDYYSAPITVYDSLGNAVPLTVTFAPVSSSAGDWNVYYSFNGTAAQRPNTTASIASSPDITFNSDGVISTGASQSLVDVPSYVNPSPSSLPDGASEPLSISLNLDNLTQYSAPSASTAFTQNGYATGTLTSFTVDQSGKISGLYSNGQQQYLYQVAMANFIAPTGLVAEGNTLYSESFASGQPAIGVANSGNFGYIADSELEQSNVNISSEFTNMIVAQNAYVANSKVLTTENSVLTALESAIP